MFVTTPYCSGLSLLLVTKDRRAKWELSNHPLLFGTVSPTVGLRAGFVLGVFGNHPLLFGTVSPTQYWLIGGVTSEKVTTPYCSGLSLLQLDDDNPSEEKHEK